MRRGGRLDENGIQSLTAQKLREAVFGALALLLPAYVANGSPN